MSGVDLHIQRLQKSVQHRTSQQLRQAQGKSSTLREHLDSSRRMAETYSKSHQFSRPRNSDWIPKAPHRAASFTFRDPLKGKGKATPASKDKVAGRSGYSRARQVLC